ncbi:MAG TPA: hypothetical protein VFU41_06440 [Gemmatimonadales bacterium]|nr:hypothetical protein [Gemmatimonadales bacterium]
MDPGAIGALIPVVAIGGFFAWVIALAASKAYMAKLQAQSRAAPAVGAGHEDVLAAVEELRREVAELAERVDFTERLIAQGQATGRLGPKP